MFCYEPGTPLTLCTCFHGPLQPVNLPAWRAPNCPPILASSTSLIFKAIRETSALSSRKPLEAPLQGYLTDKKTHPPRTLTQADAKGPRGVLGGRAISYERGTPVKALSVGHAAHVQGYLAHKKQPPRATLH